MTIPTSIPGRALRLTIACATFATGAHGQARPAPAQPTPPPASGRAPSGQQGPLPSLRSPNPTILATAGPDSFDIALHTTKGVVTVRVRRALAPKGADRVWHAVRARYYDGVRFYRVIPGFMAQFGFHGDPVVTRVWDPYQLPDEPPKVSNSRGMVTFANRGRNTRTVQLFINTGANRNLDGLGFAPIGEVLSGMAAVDSLYSEYGEGAPRGNGPDQRRMETEGNAYLSRSFPKLDAIDSARVVKSWPR